MKESLEILQLIKLIGGMMYSFIALVVLVVVLYWRNIIKVSHVKRTAESASKKADDCEILSKANDKVLSALYTSFDEYKKTQSQTCTLKHGFVEQNQNIFSNTLKEHGEKLDKNNEIMNKLQITMAELNATIKKGK